MKRIICLYLVILMSLSAVGLYTTADEYEISREGLVAWYDGKNNTRTGHSQTATVWADLAGNNDVKVTIDSKNYFTESSYHLNTVKNTFPSAVLDVINGEEFTVELKLGKIASVGSSFATFINNSGNDHFSLFIRTAGDYLEFKHSSATSDRPKVTGGKELAENSTVTVTRSLKNKVCVMYVDGIKIAEGAVSAKVGADGELFFGHVGTKGHEADYEAMRFYSRALTAEEVENNAKADGNYDFSYQPSKPYVDVAQPKTNIAGGIAFAEYIDSTEKFEAFFKKQIKPAVAVFYVDADLNLTDRSGAVLGALSLENLQTADDGTVIPAFYVKDSETAANILAVLEEKKYQDYYIMSDDPAVVKSARTMQNLCRGIIDFSEKYKGKDDLMHEEIVELRKTVISNLAHVVVLPECVASKEDISEMCKLQLTPWVMANKGLSSKKDALYLLLSGAYGVISDNTELLVDVASNTLATGTLVRTPVNIGHRGIPSLVQEVPENTIESAKLAYEKGANAIELDIYLTADKVLMVNHNSSTTFTGTSGSAESMINGKTGKPASVSIESTTSKVLSELYYPGYYEKNADGSFKLDEKGNKIVYTGFRLSTFEDYLKEFKGKDVQLIVEIKSSKTQIVSYMKELIEKYEMYDQCNVITFARTGQFESMRKEYPEMNVGYLTDTTISASADPRESIKMALTATLPNNTTYNPNRSGYNAAFVRAATYRGLTVWPWTINNSSELYQYILYGHAGITGNYCSTFEKLAREFTATAAEYAKSGSTLTVEAKVLTYGREELKTEKAVLMIVAGEDLVESVDGLNIKLKSGVQGEVSFILSYNQKMDNSYNYTLYTQPQTVKIGSEEPPVVPSPSENSSPAGEPSGSGASSGALKPSASGDHSENSPSKSEEKNSSMPAFVKVIIIMLAVCILVAGVIIPIILLKKKKK